jgi:hypothetical protein
MFSVDRVGSLFIIVCRSVEDGADTELTTFCPADWIVGNTSVLFEACHYNGQPSNIEFNEAHGLVASRALGMVFYIGGYLLVILPIIIIVGLSCWACCRPDWTRPSSQYSAIPGPAGSAPPGAQLAVVNACQAAPAGQQGAPSSGPAVKIDMVD